MSAKGRGATTIGAATSVATTGVTAESAANGMAMNVPATVAARTEPGWTAFPPLNRD